MALANATNSPHLSPSVTFCWPSGAYVIVSNYRVLVTYDPERSVYVARAPELEHCSSEGATRGEALTKLEEEIDAQLRNAREQGGRPPAPVDEDPMLSGELSAKVSRTLHRDLVWQARSEGVELGQLVGEMLAAALETRRQRGRRPTANSQPEPRAVSGADPEPPRRDDRRDDRPPNRGFGREGGGRGQGGRYHAIMEDRATFLEYVRGLDSGGGGRGPGGPGPSGPRRPRGPGGPPRPGGGGRPAPTAPRDDGKDTKDDSDGNKNG